MANFKIVENYSHEHKFNAFRADYIKGLSKKELRVKYDIPESIWKDWKSRMPTRRFSRNTRPKRPRMKRRVLGSYYFRELKSGNISLMRKVGKKDLSYGSYPDRKTAQDVANELQMHNWDKHLAYDLLQEYAVPNSKKILSQSILRRDV